MMARMFFETTSIEFFQLNQNKYIFHFEFKNKGKHEILQTQKKLMI